MARDTFKTWGEKPDSLKSRMYTQILDALAIRPMTIGELSEAVPFPRPRITQACQVMRVVGHAYIGELVEGSAGTKVRRFHIGSGADAPAMRRSRKRCKPLLPAKILAALVKPMTVQDVMAKVFYTRPAVQFHLQLLCAAGAVRISDRITQVGGTTLIYSLAPGFKGVVGVEEVVVVPHTLSNTCCDAENV